MTKPPSRQPPRGAAQEARDEPSPSPEVPYEGTAAFGRHDHSFTLQAVMDLKESVGAFGAKIDRLVVDVQEQSTKVSQLRTTVSNFKTGIIVAATLITVLGGALAGFGWWVLKDRVEAALRPSVGEPSATTPPPAPPPMPKVLK